MDDLLKLKSMFLVTLILNVFFSIFFYQKGVTNENRNPTISLFNEFLKCMFVFVDSVVFILFSEFIMS